MFKTRHFAAIFVCALAFAACSAPAQQAGIPATPQTTVARAPVPFTSPLDALGLASNTHRRKKAHGVPNNCWTQLYSKSSNVTNFTYHKNEPAGSYSMTWTSGTKIDTVTPEFSFYTNGNGTGTVVDYFSGPNQNPVISGSTGNWSEYDVQPDYDPAGSNSMYMAMVGTLSPYTIKAWVVVTFWCSP